jgi:hypothetical protein
MRAKKVVPNACDFDEYSSYIRYMETCEIIQKRINTINEILN